MRETPKDFPTRAEFYKFCLQRITAMAEANGNTTASLEALLAAINQSPLLVTDIFDQSVQIARNTLGQERETSSSLVLYVDTAMRALAASDDPDLLLPSVWTPQLAKDYLKKNGGEISILAGENTLGRNVPHRASWMLYLLQQSGNLAPNLDFIELGSSAGFILDALKEPEKYAQWLRSTQQVQLNLDVDKTAATVGYDLVPPPDTNWALASLGDDEVIMGVQEFMHAFPVRTPAIKGNILSEDIWSQIYTRAHESTYNGLRPVFITSEMLYQLSTEDRATLLGRVKSVLEETNGLFLRSDGGQYMGFPNLDMYTVGELRDQNFNLTAPQLVLQDKYRTCWKSL